MCVSTRLKINLLQLHMFHCQALHFILSIYHHPPAFSRLWSHRKVWCEEALLLLTAIIYICELRDARLPIIWLKFDLQHPSSISILICSLHERLQRGWGNRRKKGKSVGRRNNYGGRHQFGLICLWFGKWIEYLDVKLTCLVNHKRCEGGRQSGQCCYCWEEAAVWSIMSSHFQFQCREQRPGHIE